MLRKATAALAMTVIVCYGGNLTADPWSKSLDTDFTMTQSTYSDSWAGGETGNISWTWNAGGIFEKQFSPIFKFRNNSKLSFGQTHIQNKDTKNWLSPQKSTDLIDIENLGLFTLHSYVDPFIGLRLESQFFDASVPGINRYLSPAKLTESAGLARTFYKEDKKELISRLGFALRQIMTQSVADTLAGLTESSTTNDGGFESVSDLKWTLSQSLNYTSKLSIYKALFYSKAEDLKGTPAEDYWKAVDISWENKVTASVNKFITVSLYTQILYDKEISLKGRFKQTLALGITYKLI